MLDLIDTLKPQLERRTLHSNAIPTHVQVLCSLHFLATGSYQDVIAVAGGVSQSALSRFSHIFLDAMPYHIHQHIYMPRDDEEVDQTKLDFYRLARFPQAIGCIDGTHVPICPPSRIEYIFRNRKSTHSLNIQVVCDAKNITDIVAKFPGSTHDADIFRHSGLYQRLERGDFDDGYPLGNVISSPQINVYTHVCL